MEAVNVAAQCLPRTFTFCFKHNRRPTWGGWWSICLGSGSSKRFNGLALHGHHRHFLIPAKANPCWEVIAGSADDAMVRMRMSPQARKKCPDLPEYWDARAIRTIDVRGRQRILRTSLTDRCRFKAADLAECYTRRWQVETSYRELKPSMLGMALTLRSKTVEGVYQEIWDALIAST